MTSIPQFPSIDLSRVDALKTAEKAAEKVGTVLRDGAYITIGLGVLGVQQATQFAKDLGVKAQESADKSQAAAKDFTAKAQSTVKDVTAKAQLAAKDVSSKAQGAAKTATKTATSTVKSTAKTAAAKAPKATAKPRAKAAA
ncbi:MAG: hypothetical protein ACOYMR_08355 [Ilumatobacteraceae bacterium]